MSFPPHTTHRLQPLDVGVFGPFKGALSIALNDWLLSNPGKAITIRNLGELSNIAFSRAFSMSNITNAFKKPGIWPVNRQAFSEKDFAASTVTDKDIDVHNVELAEDQENNHAQRIDINKKINYTEKEETPRVNDEFYGLTDSEPIASTSSYSVTSTRGNKNNQIMKVDKKFTLEDIKPYPKARKENKKKRKIQSKSKIYTSTPVMEELKKTKEEKHRKESLKSSKSTKRKVLSEINEESDSDGDESFELIDSDIDSSVEEFPIFRDADFIVNVNDFVLTKFSSKTSIVYYIGQVLSKELNQYEIKFLRRKNTSNTFAFPAVDDISNIERDDIMMVFPIPQNSGTARTDSLYKFKFNFKGWNIR